MELSEIRKRIEQLRKRLELMAEADESRDAIKSEIEELKLLEVIAEAELNGSEGEPGKISIRDPLTLKPHPISAALYCEIDSYREIRGWRTDSVRSPESARLAVIDRTNTMDLVESIERKGILVPLVINKDGIIISGCRRWKAALELGLRRVPVEVKSFENEVEEKQAILDYNRQREKTFSQKMREAELLGEITGKTAKQRMLAGRRDPTRIFGEGFSAKRHERETATIVGAHVGMRSDTLRKGQQIWRKAKEGNQKAEELIAAVDGGATSVNAAYKVLKQAENGADGPKPSRWQRLEPVDSGEVCVCPHCNKPVRLVHLHGNNKYRLIEC